MRVLAAVSGGVDSAVAAARAVDAGHDVTAVHLALAKVPASGRSGSRGCCTPEDARDARRAADVLDVPFYVWDLADRFAADVVDDFVAEYEAGRTPNPCLRCNEKIKFAAVLDRALALGFDAVVTGHHARLSGGVLRRSVDAAKDQSYVLAVLTGDPVDRLPGNAHFVFPGCEGDSLLMLLDARGVECSTGSACSAGVAKPSHVLLAMGADADQARGSLRFSLGHSSTRADVAALLDALPPAVERARRAGLSR